MITILATIDGSATSQAVIPALEKLAGNMNACATLLTVVQRPKATPDRGEVVRAPFVGAPSVAGAGETASIRRGREPGYAESDDQALERAVEEGHTFLKAAAKPLVERGIEVKTEVLVRRDVSRAIVDFARKNQVDLIAMATHGRSGLNGLVQGSVASAVVKAGVAPVFLVRPGK